MIARRAPGSTENGSMPFQTPFIDLQLDVRERVIIGATAQTDVRPHPRQLPITGVLAQLDRLLVLERAPNHVTVQLAQVLAALAALCAVALFSPLDAALILAALVLHELGYYVALRLLGDADAPRTWLPLIRHTRHLGRVATLALCSPICAGSPSFLVGRCCVGSAMRAPASRRSSGSRSIPRRARSRAGSCAPPERALRVRRRC